MNKVFKVIWNHATQSWVAVSELTSAKGKTKSKKLTALSVAVGSALVGTPALAAVYVNNQEVTTAGGGSRIVISTGASQTIADKITPTTAISRKHDYFIRIGDAGNPVVNDGQILIGYGINNQSSGEAGDTIIGHRARMGGGNLDSFSTAVGYRVQSAGPSVSIGVGARSDINENRAWNGTENGGVAIGGYALQGGNKDGGVAIGAISGGDYNYITSVGALSGVGGFHVDQVKDKGYRIYGGNDGATSIGYRAGARGLNSVAVGREATTANFKGRDAVSVGYNTHSIGESSVALGPYAVAGGFSASEITQLQTEKTRLEGVLTDINTALQSAIDDLNQNAGTVSTVEMKFRVGQLHSAQVKAQQELNRINADLTRTSATPTQSTVTAMAIGYKANANNQNATAIGRQSQASAISAVALGTNARVNANLATSAVAIGQDANVLQNSTNAIALGTNASVVGDLNGSSNSIAIGNQTAAGNRNARWGANSARRLGFLAAQNATAVGSESIAGADNALTLGHKNTVNAPNSSAIGSNNTVGTYSNVAYVNNVASATYSGVNSHVLGSNINVTANNTVVIGNNVLVTEANRSGSVVLGDNSSVPTNTTAINSAKVGNITYSGFAGNLGGSSTDGSAEVATDQGRFVSIGNATAPRQIKHVAAGRIEADSTDAINGSQLYSLTNVVSNMGVSVANVIGGNAVLNPNGTVSGFSQPLNTTALGNEETYTAPTTPATNVSTAITNLNNYVNAGWKIAEGNDTAAKARISPNEQVNFKADGLATVSVAENATGGADVTYSVQKGTFDTTTNGTVKANPTEGVVTNTDVATAVNNSGWNTTTTGGTNVTVNPGDQVNYVNGNGTTANVTTKTVDGKDVVSVSYNVNQTTGSLNPNGTVSVADGNSFLNASTVANLVNNASFNVTTAKVDAFAENQEGKADATVKAGGNITYTAGKNIAIKQAGTNFTFSTTKDVTFENATVNQTLTVGNGTNATNFTSTAEGLKVSTSTGDKQAIVNVKSTLPGTADSKEVVTGTERTLPTLTDAQKATAATVDDVLNAGWNLRGQKAANGAVEAVDFVKPYDTVVFKSGNNATTDVITTTDADNKVSTITITAKAEPVKTSATTVNNNGTVSVATGEDGTNLVNATTVANAINKAGWNTTLSTGDTLNVNPGDQVNYVNGNGTTANVTKAKDANGNDVVSVSYNVNQTTGSVNPNGTAKVEDGNSFLNASTVANLVNNAAFNVTTAKVDAFVTNQEGKANATVKAGGNITYTAGKNIAIKQAGTNFTFATEQNVTFTNANVTSTLALGNGTAGSSSPVVNLKTENATAADVNKEAPTSALNITSADGKPTQIKGVGSSLNTSVVNVTPITDTTRTEEKLLDLGNTTNPLSEDVLNSAATVRDLTNLGWVVSANGNSYKDTVTNAKEVKFNGVNGISVTGNTTDGVRNVNISLNTTTLTSNANGTTAVTNGNSYVNGTTVADAINKAGWKTNVTQTNATTGATETVTKVVTPGTQVNYVDGNSTKANVVVTKAEDGKETVNVSYDLVTEDHLTPVANDAKSVTKPTNIDANKGKDAATVNDVLNAGWNLQANDKAVDAVTHGNNVNFTSKDGSVKITATSNGSTSSLDFAVNATSIVNQVAGTISYNKDGKATTNGDGKRIATVGDVANTINNTGWLTNVTDAKGNVTTKVVTPNTQVNYVNGDGTKANVVANSTTGGLDVTFNVKSANPETLTVDGNGVKVNTGSITEAIDVAGDANRGKVTVAAGEGNKVATVQNVANAINSASWTVKVADTQEEITTSTANDAGSSVRAGNEITHVAGKNLKVKRDGRNVTYALANDVSVNTVTAQNSIKVGAGNAATTVTTSSAQDGVTEVKLADEAGKATRITNVAAGVKDTDAVNVSQLRNSNAQINQNIAHLNNKVNRMGKDLRAGIAGSNAAAGLPQVYIPGKSMVAAAAGTFKGQSAVAVGYSRASDNGKVILKLQGNANTRGDVGGSVGVGYQW